MTQEEKYKKALLEARAVLEPCLKYSRGKVREALDSIDKELKSFESEDEMIRKELKEAFEAYDIESKWNGIPVRSIFAWLEKQKEQKPNIELIQRSWYMEGYNDRKFGNEPKWIIKTGEGGPKHELNPRYGQPLTERQVTEEQLHNLNEAIKSPPCQTGFKGHSDPVGRRGRLGMVPRWISEKAEEYQRQMEPPYDSDDIISAYESGAMWNDKRFVYGATGDPDPAGTSDLEEAAKEYASKTLCDPDDGPSVGLVKDSFIAGANYQLKQINPEQ